MLNNTSPALVNAKRLRPIQDLHTWSPDCMVAADDSFELKDESLLITDPTHLGLTMNAGADPSASYVRNRGLTVIHRFGKASCPVLWCNPYLLLPLSQSLKEKLLLPADTETLAEKISCHSGAFLFLPLADNIPQPLRDQVNKVCTDEEGAKVRLATGTYRVFYEQLEFPQGSQKELYRNIVAQKQ
ncbi:MAG: hypothetical protein ACWGP1_07625 [Syntrophobacteria bacterium]|jgi:hypothetical protein